MGQYSVNHRTPMERKCITCRRKIKPDERAFRVEGYLGGDMWKCDTCQFSFDERIENASNAKEERRKLNRAQRARIRSQAPIYNQG